MSSMNRTQTQSGTLSHLTLTFDRPMSESEIEFLRSSTNAAMALRIPSSVKAAYDREKTLQFSQSSEPDVGRLLSVLSAMLPREGRVLELGTGAGVGLAWIVHGVADRGDIRVISIERNPNNAALIGAADWPEWVSIMVGDGAELMKTLGLFDLIFADTPGGKVYGLEHTVAALQPGGVLLLDDMDWDRSEDPERIARLAYVRNQLFGNSKLCCTELALSSGVILAARKRQ